SGAPDDRKVVIGWMSNWQYAAEVPTKQFRSANTLPRDLSLFEAPDGEVYLSTVPSPEVDALRGKIALDVKRKSVGSKPSVFKLPIVNDGACEILLNIDSENAKTVDIVLANAANEKVVMTFDPSESKFTFDRTQSGITDFSKDFPAVVWAPTFRKSTEQKLRIFIDRSSIEIFDVEGNFVMTNLVFPNQPYSTLSVSSNGGKARIDSLKIYNIKNDNK
ncbi:MAG: glycoside hydrolase family 32 protein, partial [Muribaculaceae bacterium]|nr:glycoside hydrolase family 32 protein [Muribaculaceae bacterium]